MKRKFESLDQTADLRLRVRGGSPEDLFQNAVRAVFTAMKPRKTAGRVRRRLKADGLGLEDLFVNFLNELLTNADTHQECYDKARIKIIKDRRLVAQVSGFGVLGVGLQIKAATHHDLALGEKDGCYEATVVLDV